MATQEEAEALLAEIMEMVNAKEAAKPSTPVHGPLRLRVKQEVSYKEMEENEFRDDDDDESSEDENKAKKRTPTPQLTKSQQYDRVYYREKAGILMFCHICRRHVTRHYVSRHKATAKHLNAIALLTHHGIPIPSPSIT